MRKFSWFNFSKFIAGMLAVIFWLWILWSIVDIDLHNERKGEYPSEVNAFVLFVELLEREVNVK